MRPSPILLDRIDGPVEFTQDGSDDDSEAPIFDIREVLEEELEFMISDHAEAKYDLLDETVITEKYAALQQHRQVIDQANVYLCAIEDEINKGGTVGVACRYQVIKHGLHLHHPEQL